MIADDTRERTRRAERAQRVQRRIEPAMLIAALLVIPTLLIEANLDAGEDLVVVANWLNWAIWLTFLAEALLMIALVPDRWHWIRTHPLEIAVIVLTPPVMPQALQSLRAIRLLRLLRVIKALSVVRRAFSTRGLAWAALALLITVVGGGAVFASIEGSGEEISSWDGVWWAVTTVTTVGYGDYAPATTGGRLVAVLVMTAGIGFVAMLTGAAAERFVNRRDASATDASSTRVAASPVDEQAAGDHVLARLEEIAARLATIEDRLDGGHERPPRT